ncbi:MAG: CDP-alcohol phosphatidyltransferase family protein [Candidatus Bathyarchaeota archaeon]|nr:CDP-alcohol phosphatidyltransferase family protein [Candidatus Bathyarchaeota archaeon]
MQVSMAKAFSAFRMILKPVLTRFPLLRQVDANMISGLGLVFTPIAYLLLSERAIAASIIAIFLILLLDALDGIVARAKGQTSSKDGWMVDVSVDRISEAVISLALSRVFILLTILNMGLALLSYRYKKHAIIPLRHAILLILIAYYLLEKQPAFLILDQILFQW